ncbi:RCC1 and BTB domain-containing protein 1 [Folsomia candida]|uniref:RCC1 and BTB domain-containing protein 1 n=1 Tax=Folsomia candida TaxID=158441 RepID=UPI001605031C|nr:RCC1 and BTB domain-containing protein 1 [Folsomia candida]
MEPSPAIIPQEKLKIWKIFRDVGPEGEEILKLVKLAHVANEKEAFVVTSADETFSFLREEDGLYQIAKIPELCHVQVKELVTGSINLAITEDGQLYSWCSNFTLTKIHKNIYEQLGRFRPVSKTCPDPNFISHPEIVTYTAAEKVVQVALSELHEGRVVALTGDGDVIHWGAISWDTDSPIFIPCAKFDNKELISIVCGVGGMTFALSEDGEIFQWKLDAGSPTKSDICSTPVKKLVATKGCTYALTADGTLYFCCTAPNWNPLWVTTNEFENVQDIETCWTGNVVVIEWKNGTRLAWDLTTKKWPSLKAASVDEYFAELCQKSHRTIGSPSTSPVWKEALDQEISNLWRNKNDVDVTFSVEGKTITAHKLVLASKSDYFANMFSTEWKETAGSEIDIKVTKYVTFEAFLFYLYHGRVTFAEAEYESIFVLRPHEVSGLLLRHQPCSRM